MTVDTHPHPVSLSADGRIAISGDSGETVRVWDVLTGACLHTLTGLGPVSAVTLSADGRIALSAARREEAVRVWDVPSGACARTLTGHTGRVDEIGFCAVDAVALSADGRIAVTGGSDMTVRVWDVLTADCLRTLTGTTERVRSAALSADGTTAATCCDGGTIRVWTLDWDYEFPAQPDAAAVNRAGAGGTVTAALRDTSAHTYALASSVIRIGRLADNDIVLSDPQVSDHHAAIIAKASAHLIADLRSSNGVYVNGERIKSSAALTDGAVIGIAGHMLTFEIQTV